MTAIAVAGIPGRAVAAFPASAAARAISATRVAAVVGVPGRAIATLLASGSDGAIAAARVAAVASTHKQVQVLIAPSVKACQRRVGLPSASCDLDPQPHAQPHQPPPGAQLQLNKAQQLLAVGHPQRKQA
eukprot:343940-Chlamydomonas_euryale.AAC.1